MADASAPATRDDPVGVSPILAYLGEARYEFVDDTSRARRQIEEEYTEQCMEGAGFTYVGRTAGAISERTSGPTPGVTNFGPQGAREYDAGFVARYGYAFSTTFEGASLEVATVNTAADPNVEILASLSTTERAAYMLALFGDPEVAGELLEVDGTESENPAYGCLKNATIRALRVVNQRPPSFIVTFQLVDAVLADVAADPEVVAAYDRWSECMSVRGFAARRPDVARQSVFERFEELRARASASTSPDGAHMILTFPHAELDQLRQLEMATAHADLACAQAHLGVVDEVQDRYEQDLIRQHEDELALMREWFEDNLD